MDPDDLPLPAGHYHELALLSPARLWFAFWRWCWFRWREAIHDEPAIHYKLRHGLRYDWRPSAQLRRDRRHALKERRQRACMPHAR